MAVSEFVNLTQSPPAAITVWTSVPAPAARKVTTCVVAGVQVAPAGKALEIVTVPVKAFWSRPPPPPELDEPQAQRPARQERASGATIFMTSFLSYPDYGFRRRS